LNVNTQIADLANTQLWMEIERADYSFVKSNNDPLTVASGITDWTQWITSDSFVVAAQEDVKLNIYESIYHGSSKVFLAGIYYSVDAGTSWIRCPMSWVDGEITWTMPTGNPAAADVKGGVFFGQSNEFEGTLPKLATIVENWDGTTYSWDGYGAGDTQGGGYVEVNGVTLTVTSWSDTHIDAEA